MAGGEKKNDQQESTLYILNWFRSIRLDFGSKKKSIQFGGGYLICVFMIFCVPFKLNESKRQREKVKSGLEIKKKKTKNNQTKCENTQEQFRSHKILWAINSI